MASSVLDSDLAAALDQISAGLDAVFAAGVDPVDARDAVVLVRETEVLARRLRAVQIDELAAIDQRGLHRHDGHASAKVHVRHVANLSNLEAHRRAKAARCLRDLPEVAAAARNGRIGSCQVDRIANAHANERVRDRLCAQDADLARLAAREPYRVFDARLADWVRGADEDGTCDRAQRHHENRDAKLVQDFDQSWKLAGGCGSLQGLELHDILQRFIDAEWRTDWAKARAEHGDAATVDDLARTNNQRRFDALFEIFQRAAGSPTGRGGSLVVTNLIIDLVTFERICRRMTGAPVDLDPRLAELLRSARPTNEDDNGDGTSDDDETAADTDSSGDGGDSRPGVGYRCSGIDGQPIDPTEAVTHALTGHIRRVIIDTDSTVINLSRRRRLFTGAAALAAKLANTECYWPGCHVPVTDCQIDHLIAWADHGGGSTNPANGGPACGKHNRYKEHGYHAWRDHTGTWHIQRPDGTEID